MFLRPAQHSAGLGSSAPTIAVDLSEEFLPRLALESVAHETVDDEDIYRTLTSSEARELAAMLWHYAEESDRRLRSR